MLVYRIEKLGRGPYTSGTMRRLNLPCIDCPDTPTPESDGIAFVGWSNERCGFKSLDDLKAWFDKQSLEKLHDVGFYVTVMRVNEVHVKHGRKQVVFPRTKARIVKKTPIVEILA